MTIRPYNAERDAKAVRRIWREVHWINSDDEEQMMDHFLAVVRAFVMVMDPVAVIHHLNLKVQHYKQPIF